MKYLYFLLFFICNYTIFCQDTIFRFEEKPLTGKILFTDPNIILYNKNNIIKDISTNFVFGYKKNNKLSILYKEKGQPFTTIQMNDIVMGRTKGYQDHNIGIPFTIGFFSSYFYTYYNTRGLTRNPKFSSLAFTAVPSLLFTYIKPRANKKWSLEKRVGYQLSRSEKNQVASFWGAVLGTATIFTLYFSSN